MRKILLILLLFISVGCNKQNIEEITKEPVDEIDDTLNNKEELEDNTQNNDGVSDDEPINIYLFWGDDCGACANLKEFFNNLDNSYNNYFNLIKYEVWYNEENYELMHKIGDYLNQTYYAVPFLVVGDEIIIGADDAKKEYILEKIIEEYNNDRYDVMDRLK